MKRRMTIMIIALVVVFGGLIAYNIIKGVLIKHFFAHFTPPAVTVSSVTAKANNWVPYLHAVGNFLAINGVEVNSQAAGNVVAIHFRSGQYAKENTPLINIDDSIDQAVLKSNKAELALQEISYQRQVDLFKRGATAVSMVDQARAKLLQAQADVEKTEAGIRQKHITTPFAGQLGIRQVNLGQYIVQGKTTIVPLQSMDPLYLQFYLPEQLIEKLFIGQTIYFSVEHQVNYIFQGKITAINSKVDTNTHNILVQATIANCPSQALTDPQHSSLVTIKHLATDDRQVIVCNSDLNKKNNIEQFSFVPGIFAAIEIEQPVLKDAIALPSTAISYSLYGDSVFVIEKEKDAANHDTYVVKRTFIKTGDQQGNFTIIKSGIKAGQLVVNSGEIKLQNGTHVIINNSVQLNEVLKPKELGE